MREKRSKISAYGMCVQGQELLLALYRDRNSEEEWWTLPGGKVEHGEDPIEAVEREIHEETGFLTSPTNLLGVGSRTHGVDWGIPGGADLHVLSVFYEMEIRGGQIADEIDGETVKAQWIPLENVVHLDRAVVVDQGIALLSQRPADGRPIRLTAVGKIRN